MILVHTDESKDTIIKDKNLWNKTGDTFTSITNSSNNHGEKYTRIKFNSTESVFHQGNKYYPQIFLGKGLSKL